MKKIFSLFLFLMTAGCVSFGSSQPSKFYTLQENAGAAVSQVRMSIGIEEVQIPAYLDKPQIVTHKDNSVELGFSEENRWSEALSTMMQRVVVNDVASYLPNAVVKARNMGREQFDYTVFIEVDKFSGVLGKEVFLHAWWYVMNKNGQIVLREKFVQNRSVGGGYDDLVYGEGMLTAALSEDIARKMAKLRR